MAMTRIEVDNYLKEILGSDHVYFQPPESVKLKYPCIVYNMVEHDVDYADDSIYQLRHKYSIKYLALPKDYDSPMKDHIAQSLNVPMTQVYVSNGVYHCVFTKIL